MSKPKATARRVRVERNIYRRPTGVFEVGLKDGDGVQRWRTVDGGITAARALRDELLASRGRGERVAPNPRLGFAEAADIWLAGPVADLRASTQAGYRNAVDRHLRPRYAATTPGRHRRGGPGRARARTACRRQERGNDRGRARSHGAHLQVRRPAPRLGRNDPHGDDARLRAAEARTRPAPPHLRGRTARADHRGGHRALQDDVHARRADRCARVRAVRADVGRHPHRRPRRRGGRVQLAGGPQRASGHQARPPAPRAPCRSRASSPSCSHRHRLEPASTSPTTTCSRPAADARSASATSLERSGPPRHARGTSSVARRSRSSTSATRTASRRRSHAERSRRCTRFATRSQAERCSPASPSTRSPSCSGIETATSRGPCTCGRSPTGAGARCADRGSPPSSGASSKPPRSTPARHPQRREGRLRWRGS